MAKLPTLMIVLSAALALFGPGTERAALAQVPGGGGRAECDIARPGQPPLVDGGLFPVGPASCALGNNASASIDVRPYVLLQGRVDAGGLPVVSGSGASVIVELQYDFIVTGGTFGDAVPVDIASRMFAAVSPSPDPNNANSADASIALFRLSALGGNPVANDGLIEACAVSPDVGGCTSRYDGTTALAMKSGSAERLLLQIILGASPPSGGTASAWIDPYIFIDPAFARAGDYRIAVSGGVGNAPPPSDAVPEPATWELMLAGFAGLGMVRRRATRMTCAIA